MSATLNARTTKDHAHVDAGVRPLSVVLGVARLAMGWTFLWPFLDKTFGLGHETANSAEGPMPGRSRCSRADGGGLGPSSRRVWRLCPDVTRPTTAGLEPHQLVDGRQRLPVPPRHVRVSRRCRTCLTRA